MLLVTLLNFLLGLTLGLRYSAWILFPVAIVEVAGLVSGMSGIVSSSAFALALACGVSLQLGYCVATFGLTLRQAARRQPAPRHPAGTFDFT